ncbi:MAG TPA: GNAT family N-acetyltransferase, partial [Pseudolabrys sp.]|nr:GNAT family N-acetyltransferase [Pseudolabrys sp.]
WQALIARAAEPNAFYEPAFALAGAPVFGPGAHALLVWSRQPDKRLVGLFPVRVARRYGVGPRLLAGWIHPFAMLGTPLVDRDHAEAVIAAWLDRVAAEPALPNLALLPTLSLEGPFSTALDRVLASRGLAPADFGLHRRALLAPGNDRAGYLKDSMGGKHRKELPRRRRRLAELGPVAHDIVTAEPDVEAAFERFLELEARGWKGGRGTAAMNCKQRLRFFRQAVADLARDGKARVDLLRVGDRVIATTVALRSGDSLFGWKMAYDEGYAKYSPGAQLMLGLTEDVLADGSLARVDSCAAANHPMIDHLWRDRHAIADRLLPVDGHRRAVFGAACILEDAHRRALRSAKGMRDKLRESLQTSRRARGQARSTAGA